ncbi:GerAB/ArcD/ProY family transporter [Paenibacillus alkalitolerans]|uniref:GerAB/ArcD/ProY family transporter n=1 Tax=Paenibacillus alkalitolerans TaxID=2799335 RepID=UPI0018F414CA|nr:GerAB/ArcD/ProY family transporter [Paenibacillus alkalitolerans]
MEKTRISPGQLFAILVLFDMGTAVIRVLGIKAEKDAWLAILLGLPAGLAVFLVYASLYRKYPQLSLTGYMRAILGKWIGWPLGLLYVLWFINGAARDVREGADLLVSAVLDRTPVIIVAAIMVMSVGYVLCKGIEVLARTAQIFLAVLAAAGLFSILLLIFAGIVDVNRLLPVLANGWLPVIDTTLRQTIEFPHVEVVCFTFLLPYLNHPVPGIRAGIAAVLISGLILSFSTAVNIAVLGIDIAGRATFPLLATISLINIGEFIQRLDVLVVLTLIIGDFFKVAVYFYAAVMGAADLFQVRDYRRLVYPVGIIIIYISMMIAGSFLEQIEEGDLLLYTVWLTFGGGIPVLLLAAAAVRRRFRPQG